MSVLPKFDEEYPHMTEAEYLALDDDSEIKHEYFEGLVLAMVGATRKHNLITGSTYAHLYAQLRKRPCEVYPSDMRVKFPTGSYAYPDIIVVCDKPKFSNDKETTLLNPTLIIEVLSPGTEGYDRGLKFQHYRALDSLQTYILIAQHAPLIEQFERGENNTWVMTEARGLDTMLTLAAVDCSLPLAEVYDQITFEDDPDDNTPPQSTDQPG